MARSIMSSSCTHLPASPSIQSHRSVDRGSCQTLSHLRAFAFAIPSAWNAHPWALQIEAPSQAAKLLEPISHHPVGPLGCSHRALAFSSQLSTRILDLRYFCIYLFVFLPSHSGLSDKIWDIQLNLNFR